MIVGRISELIVALICLTFTFLLVIISFLIKGNVVSKIALIVFVCIPVIVTIVQIQKNKEIGAYIKIDEKKVQLKRFGIVLQEYSIKELKCGYTVFFYGKSALYPSLMITNKEIQPRVENMGYYKGFDYFIITLNKKRLEYLTKWYKKEIVLSVDSLMELNYPGKEEIEKFYNLINGWNLTKRVSETRTNE